MDNPDNNLSFQFLLEEYNFLKYLFVDAEKVIQTSFRYYITLLLAIFGGLIALIIQENINQSINKNISKFSFTSDMAILITKNAFK